MVSDLTVYSHIDDVNAVNNAVLENFMVKTVDLPPSNQSLPDLCKDFSIEDFEFYIGKLGLSLHKFFQTVDAEHPTLASMFEGIFSPSSIFSTKLVEVLKLSSFARQNNLSNLQADIQEALKLGPQVKKFIQKLPASILKDENERRLAREGFHVKQIDLGEIEGIQDLWNNTCDGLVPYVRLGEGFRSLIEYNERIAVRFNDIGVIDQSSRLLNQNKELIAKTSDNYHGFVRIHMKEAAVILAKLHGCNSETRSDRLVVNFSMDNFKHPFWEYWKAEDPLKGKSGTNLAYRARVYPLPKFPVPLTQYTERIIQGLEHHPNINNKTLFDNIWVIVPSVAFIEPILNIDGEKRKYDDLWQAYKDLDRWLIQTQQVTPVILGESLLEKKCYFISYWV